MGLTQLNLDGKTKVEVSINRLRYAATLAGSEGLYLAFSGGKDSQSVYDLAVVSEVKFDAHYNMTGVDAPELVQFIRDYYPKVEMHRPPQSIFKSVQTMGLPRRQARWCCELLKEFRGSGRWVITGVRWAESPQRQSRQSIEVCRTDKTKYYVNPIIEWSTSEVWEYLKTQGLPYCSLYDEGATGPYRGDGEFKRLGCVMCPMTTYRQTMAQAARWPKIAEAWRRAAYRYHAKDIPSVKQWATPEEFWQWWLSRRGQPKASAQCVMFE